MFVQNVFNLDHKTLNVIYRYTDIWRNKIHDDSFEKSFQQNGNVDTNEVAPNIRSVNLREVRTIEIRTAAALWV